MKPKTWGPGRPKSVICWCIFDGLFLCKRAFEEGLPNFYVSVTYCCLLLNTFCLFRHETESKRNLDFPFSCSYIHNIFPFLAFDTNNNPNSFNYCFPLNFSNPWGCRTLVCSLLLFAAMGEVRCRKPASATGVLDISSCWALQELSKITSHLISFLFKLSAWWNWCTDLIKEKIWPRQCHQ